MEQEIRCDGRPNIVIPVMNGSGLTIHVCNYMNIACFYHIEAAVIIGVRFLLRMEWYHEFNTIINFQQPMNIKFKMMSSYSAKSIQKEGKLFKVTLNPSVSKLYLSI